MADPICRWRNTTIKQIVEFTNILPHTVMPKSEAHKYIEERWQLWDGSNNFFRTPYQLAVQLALYYEDDTTFYPRFNHVVSLEEAQSYLSMWIRRYYVPNPYTGSFSDDSNPLILNQELLAETSNNQNISLDDFFLKHFNVELGNKDILMNLMNQFSDLSVINGYVKQKENIVPLKHLTPPSNNVNKKIFFEWFGRAENANPTKVQDPTSRQIIYYGAPGTGKSHKIKELVKPGNHVRTTFHPDSDYASFVGAYKPTMIETFSRDMAGHVIIERGNPVQEKKIIYEFVAQAFLQAYIEAWKRSVSKMTDANGENVDMPQDMDDRYYLVIEEINRGNCAQIFGDLFQLLDRDDDGESSYAIRPDQDMKRHIAEQFKGLDSLPEAIHKGEEMKLPSNFYILATMNTSDQSLFPIDSAFKRRWEWKYVPISDAGKRWVVCVNGVRYDWWSFIKNINNEIGDTIHSEDKKLGYFFCKANPADNTISADRFVGKVLFYIYNDVFKDYGFDNPIFKDAADKENPDLLFKDYFLPNGKPKEEKIQVFLNNLKIKTEAEVSELNAENINGKDSESLEDDMSQQDALEEGKSSNVVAPSNDTYTFDGVTGLSAPELAVKVITKYLDENPDVQFNELKQRFPDSMMGDEYKLLGLLVTEKILKNADYETQKKTYGAFSKDVKYKSGDGIVFFINTNWSSANIKTIVDFAIQQGWTVEKEN